MIINYLKDLFRVMSLIVTTLVLINLILQTAIVSENINELLVITAISGLLHFLVKDNETDSNRLFFLKQIIYLALICVMVTLANITFSLLFIYLSDLLCIAQIRKKQKPLMRY